MTKCRFYVFLLVLLMAVPGTAIAQYCPGQIAAIEGDPLSRDGALYLTQMYEKLGCKLEVRFLPGRRGVQEFNSADVDGELYRLRIIEDKYVRPFLRSVQPLFSLTNAVWVHPDPAIADAHPLGYVLGIAWHEKFVSELPVGDATRLLKFHSEDDVVAAYNKGVIGSFLTEKQTVDILVQGGAIVPAPVRKTTISAQPLYHYLGREFGPFMGDFSTLLTRDNLFKKLE